MPGLIGRFGISQNYNIGTSLLETIDPLSNSHVHTANLQHGVVAVATLKNSPLKGSSSYENSYYQAFFTGDLPDDPTVPWSDIVANFHANKHQMFAKYSGAFALCVYEKLTKTVYVISDRRSQQPIYYLLNQQGLTVSTSLATFCRLSQPQAFNTDWLYESVFFNFPIGQTTFLRNVQRMPPASVLKYDIPNCQTSIVQYAEHFQAAKSLICRAEAIDKAFTVFEKRVPYYFGNGSNVAFALSGGIDSRTLLSFAPHSDCSVETYTYGVRGCFDLLEAAQISRRLNLPHREIYFDKTFLDNLPHLIYQTVYLSHGLQGINRSTLVHAYQTLTDNGRLFPIVVSGVSGDHLFRGHGNVPSIISQPVSRIFTCGTTAFDANPYRILFGDNVKTFDEHIRAVLGHMEAKYGPLNTAAAQLCYLIYEVAPKYFAGEAAIAGNYSTFRAPYWDIDLISLAYEIELSTLSFSKFIKQDRYAENILQACLIGRNQNLAGLPVGGIPIDVFSGNNRLAYYLYRVLKRGPNRVLEKLKPASGPPLEDWRTWYKAILGPEIDHLISKRSAIANYVDPAFLDKIKRENDRHWLGKIVTAEIVLKLINDEWQLNPS